MFILVDPGTNDYYVLPAKVAAESTIRLLLAGHQQELLTVYTEQLRAYDPLEGDDAFDREYVDHGDGEYADGAVHANTSESHGCTSDPWFSPLAVSLSTNSPCIFERSSYAAASSDNPGNKRLKPFSKLCSNSPTIYATRAFLHYLRIYLDTSSRLTIGLLKEMPQIIGEIDLDAADHPTASTLLRRSTGSV